MSDTTDTRIYREIEAAKALRLSLGADADDAELLEGMIEGETSLMEMIDAVLDLIERDKELIDGMASREQELKDRKERVRYRQSGRIAKIEQAMLIFGERKLERPDATIYMAKNPVKMVITDEELVPTQFWKRGDPQLDKTGLKEALKGLAETDEPIPGVVLEASPDTLRIRRK